MTDASPGLMASARQVLARLMEIGHTRLELLTVELEEERLYMARSLFMAIAALMLLLFGVLFAAVWVVLLCPPADRVTAVGVLCALFFAAGALLVWQLQRMARSKPRFLHATLGEFKRDQQAFTGEPSP